MATSPGRTGTPGHAVAGVLIEPLAATGSARPQLRKHLSRLKALVTAIAASPPGALSADALLAGDSWSCPEGGPARPVGAGQPAGNGDTEEGEPSSLHQSSSSARTTSTGQTAWCTQW